MGLTHLANEERFATAKSRRANHDEIDRFISDWTAERDHYQVMEIMQKAGVAAGPGTAEMQGRSLVPLLRGEDPADWRTSVYYHYYEYPAVHSVRRHYGVRTARYKLIHYYNLGEWELFDLEADPDELINLYDDPAHADLVADLEVELARLREQYAVPEVDPDTAGS